MSQHKILIVEDDLDISNLISRYLQKQNYSVHAAFNGKEALEILTSNDYHLIILDLMLPEINGYTIIEIIRKQKNVPVLIVSAKSDEIDKIEALDLGADDYITKPFTVGELLARVNAQIRRFVLLNGSNQELHNMLKFKNLLLNLETYEAFKDDLPIALSAKEFEILRVFIENPNKVFSKPQLYRAIWKDEYLGEDNVIMVQINRLRSKIEDNPSNPDYIQTVWGIGYRLKKD
ncbi:PhoP family transcriptional regulator [Lysinibacillus sp. FJAT-14745]|uniref:response regulator transcription factor n=1 Tax=Lysinibacillus sp. FJAT-14745 TaxID=1704289 RepID=UPI0006AB7A18|nr:response regulator transcription factor [Lysinibacillus sp. FJAT-14745]KOP72403.1 PhoP family transcriptional regulator [Lysinibacillus sp. FJAT-14745]